MVNEKIETLQKKYINGLPFAALKETKYNKALKSIFEKSGLTQTHKYITDVAGRKVEKEERLCDIITNHFARHTFITNKVREGWNCDDLCYATGHADDEMIRKVYAHITQNDKVKKVVSEHLRINQKEENNKNQKNGNSFKGGNIRQIMNMAQTEIHDILGIIYENNDTDIFDKYLRGFPTNEEFNYICGGAEVIDILKQRLSVCKMKLDENYKIVEKY